MGDLNDARAEAKIPLTVVPVSERQRVLRARVGPPLRNALQVRDASGVGRSAGSDAAESITKPDARARDGLTVVDVRDEYRPPCQIDPRVREQIGDLHERDE